MNLILFQKIVNLFVSFNEIKIIFLVSKPVKNVILKGVSRPCCKIFQENFFVSQLYILYLKNS